MRNEVQIEICSEKPSYSVDETIILKCAIKNLSTSDLTLFWDNEPRYVVWINGGIVIDSYGKNERLVPIQIKAKGTLVKEVHMVQNKNIPYLPEGKYKTQVNFKFGGDAGFHLVQSVEISMTGFTTSEINMDSIVANARKFLKKYKSETIIDYEEGKVTDHMRPISWTVSFSNKGPEMFGETDINVDKKTGDASWPSHETLVPIP